MSVVYVGNCNWRLIKSQPHKVADNIPGLLETWFGRSDQLQSFLNSNPLYKSYQGGYITKVDPDDAQGPFATCELTVTQPPDFTRVLQDPDLSIKTATVSANVAGDNLIPSGLIPKGSTAPNPLPCQHNISFYAAGIRYTYFSNMQPAGPRFGSAGSAAQPTPIRSVITCQLSGSTVTFAGADAPAPIVSALFMSVGDKLSGFSAKQIPGTPWFECTDVLTREYVGE